VHHFVAASEQPVGRWLAVVGWICLGIAVLAMLFAMTFSQKACLAQVEIVERRLNDPAYGVRGNVLQKVTGLLNWIALGALSLGLGSIAAFAAFNFL